MCRSVLCIRHVKRRWLWGGEGGVAVASVQEQHARQAGCGDLLLLKGHAFPGNYGLGAVHKSPGVPPGGRRLLLTIDDVVGVPGGCACGGEHDAHLPDASLAA